MSNQAGMLPLLDQEQRACCAPLTSSPMDAAEAARLTHVFKALADPVRLRLLALIGAHDGGEACVCDLTAAFDLTAPTISHHLKVLREAGLITADRRGTWVYYRLVPAALADLAGLFTPAPQPAAIQPQSPARESAPHPQAVRLSAPGPRRRAAGRA